MDINENSRALICLSARLGIGDVDPLKAREVRQLKSIFPNLSELFGKSSKDLEDTGVSSVLAERIMRLIDRSSGVMSSLVRLEEMGIKPLTTYDDDYPQQLKQKLRGGTPNIIFYSGEVNPLANSGIGIVGSRKVNEGGLKTAKEFAQKAVELGYSVVSGGAEGIDQAAMQSAVAVGGLVITSLGHSLVASIESSEVRRLLFEGQVVFMTPYGPEEHFSVGNVMGNNRIIYALSKTTVVVASERESGGTWAGATEAMKRGFGHVTVWNGDGKGSGNEFLIGNGATPIDELSNFEEILDSVALPNPFETYEQERLL